MKYFKPLALVAALLASALAHADINVGVTVSATGPAASLGIPEKNTIALMPKTIAGQKINYIVLDDASDTTAAVNNTRKLISENKVDVILGSTTTPNSLAMIDVASESQTPMISMAASARIVEPVDAKKRWVFKTPQNDIMMSLAIAEHMAANGVKTVGFVGFSDAYGEGWFQEFTKAAELKKLQIVANERYARTDTSVTGQVLKMMASKPDAVLLGGAATQGALPPLALAERGYKGPLYGTPALLNTDFIRVGGKAVEGVQGSAGPVIVAEQLPDTHFSKQISMDFRAAYQKANNTPTSDGFSAYSFDAWLVFLDAAKRAMASGAKPGTPEFRTALKNAMFTTKDLVGTHAVYNFKPGESYGVDERSLVLVRLVDGKWKYEP